MILQFLRPRSCGVRTITTCSPHNFDLVKSYGADDVYNYKDAECAAKIRADTGNTLEYAIDCVAEESSMRFCYAALGRVGGKYVALNPSTISRPRARSSSPTGSWPPVSTRLILAASLCQLLNEDKLRSHPVRLEDGGLSGLLNGVEILRKGGVSGQKLVLSFFFFFFSLIGVLICLFALSRVT
ncbi:hypothetical protein F4680DRAFT_455005 [Xylaria scruposa]|nr:hypothetical protein F4680DRAFT_455005 [Xylaria scruposa]